MIIKINLINQKGPGNYNVFKPVISLLSQDLFTGLRPFNIYIKKGAAN